MPVTSSHLAPLTLRGKKSIIDEETYVDNSFEIESNAAGWTTSTHTLTIHRIEDLVTLSISGISSTTTADFSFLQSVVPIPERFRPLLISSLQTHNIRIANQSGGDAGRIYFSSVSPGTIFIGASLSVAVGFVTGTISWHDIVCTYKTG